MSARNMKAAPARRATTGRAHRRRRRVRKPARAASGRQAPARRQNGGRPRRRRRAARHRRHAVAASRRAPRAGWYVSRPHGERDRQAAGDEDERIGRAIDDFGLVRGGLKRRNVQRAREAEGHYGAEEQHLAHQEEPHAKGRRLTLARDVRPRFAQRVGADAWIAFSLMSGPARWQAQVHLSRAPSRCRALREHQVRREAGPGHG